ncbi:hypothetical protein T484DRAFT_1816816 [Baffinella frigidus]|nr:hypothetical protein T484DRAFT_1816816 [Cryptophyta sp. CCMP2293]
MNSFPAVYQVTVEAHNSPATVNEFAAADISGIASAFAGAGRRDEPLFWHLSAVGTQLPENVYSIQDMCKISSALATLEVRDRHLLAHMSRAARLKGLAAWTRPQALEMLDAYASLRVEDAELVAHLVEAVGATGGDAILCNSPAGAGDKRQWLISPKAPASLPGSNLPVSQLWIPDKGDVESGVLDSFSGRLDSDGDGVKALLRREYSSE